MSVAVAKAPVSPYAELFRAAVRAGHEARASDIHIQPSRDGVAIRFRVFGVMQEPWKTLSKEHSQSLLLAVKKETRLQIGVSGRPQDARCTVDGLPIDLRVNLLPTHFGERIVLRLLDSSREFGIENLGIPDATLEALLAALNHRNGVVLISGPTGSGKTTTLYSLLCAVDRKAKNVVTLEDPVEYTIEGISQVQVDQKVSFAGALRAVLRQDPDVILVGEIRDEETAALAFKAAATGHLVLSTVHANGAVEVVNRLLNLGVDRDTIRDNLRFSAAQRLVPKLCNACKQVAPSEAIDAVFAAFCQSKPASAGSFQVRNPAGCPLCRGGVIGRVPAIEYLSTDGGELVSADPKLAVSLTEAALLLAATGEIDVREVASIA
jgi:type IV pilus assembly protein PilB